MRSASVCVGRRSGFVISGVVVISILVFLGSRGVDAGVAVRTRNATRTGIDVDATTMPRTSYTPYPETQPPTTMTMQLQTKRVKCYYFKTDPVRTYCHVLGLKGSITASEANKECNEISMNLLSIKTTPQHRICTLMKVFKLDETKLWIADMSDTLPNSTLSRCNLEVLDETVSNVDRRCKNCSIAVLCDAGFYHSNGANCVTVQEDSRDVEYCYHKEPLGAYESELQCRNHSTDLMNETILRQHSLLNYVRPIVRTDLEFWVNMRKEDVSEVSGVIAFNTFDHDWNHSCVTVWFGRDVPWFFRRECEDTFQIVCQDTNNKWRNHSNGALLPHRGHEKYPQKNCFYHASHSWTFGYCVPEGHKFTISEGMEFCKSRSMELLRGSTLRELFYVSRHLEKHHHNNMDRYLVWDSDFRQFTKDESRCIATSLHESESRNSASKELGCTTLRPYICRRVKNVRPDGTTDDPDDDPRCDNVQRSPGLNLHACLNVAPLTYRESVSKCSDLGLKLLNQSLSITHYENLTDDLGLAVHYSEAVMYWLLKNDSDKDKCAALLRNGGTFILKNYNCEAKLPFVCVHDFGNGPESLYCPAKKEYDALWPRTPRGLHVVRSCPRSVTAKMSRTCKEDGQWGLVNDTECVSSSFKNTTESIMSEDSFSAMIKQLANISSGIKTHSDLKSVATALDEIVKAKIESIPQHERGNKTRDIADSVVTAINGAMAKETIWNAVAQEERLITAFGMMNVLETVVLQMLEYQPANDATSAFNISNKYLRVEATKVTANRLRKPVMLPSNQSNNSLKLPANFLSGNHGNVSILFAEYTNVYDILHPLHEEEKSPSRRLQTAVLTATVMLEGKVVTAIEGPIDLTFKVTPAYRNPTCVFLNKDAEWKNDGCRVKSATIDEVVCSCDHLTNFAVLMSPKAALEDDRELHWITVISCLVSIACLALCIAVFSIYRHLKGIRNTIHRNLCVSLLIGEIILLLGLDKDSPFVKSPGVCTTVALLLHFFFLSAFAWMALEGCNIIVLLWKVFNQKRTYYERYYIAGYGIPLIISCVTFGIRQKYYGKGNVCWLPVEYGARFSFIGPVAAVICLNFGALGLVLWKMSHVKAVVEKSTIEKVRNWVRGTLILLPILGLTWLLGFLMLGSDKLYEVGAYLFTVFNSLQGLGIFVCHVLMNKKTRDAIKRSIMNTGSMVKGSISSRSSRSGTSSSRTTWYPFTRSSTSSRAAPAPENPSPNNSKSPSSSSDTDTDANPCPELECWPGARFKYDLKLGEYQGDKIAPDIPLDKTVLPRFRPSRQSEA
uniref:Putative latrophilin-3 n=2 Tax=Ixodes ricinus TaxID=34613 RepID=V5H823_IXORI